MNKKQIISIVASILIIVAGVVIFLIMMNSSKKAEDLDSSNKMEISSNIDLENYVGYWFLNKNNISDMYFHIKEVNFNDIKFDLYVNNYIISDLEITVKNGKGKLSYVDGEDSLKGELSLYDNQMLFIIKESTFQGLEIGKAFKYSYRQDSLEKEEKPVKKPEGKVLSSYYVGTWYENYDTDFKNNMIVMGIDGITINIYLTVDGTSFKVIKTDIVDNHGNFEVLTLDESGKITGDIVLKDKTIELTIKTSTVKEISNEKKYEFKLKSTRINVNDYFAKWYTSDKIENTNYIEIKSYNKGYVIFDLIYGNKAQITNVSAVLKNNIATFECEGSDERVLGGNIVFDDGKVYLAFNNSTVDTIKEGTIVEYNNKGGN